MAAIVLGASLLCAAALLSARGPADAYSPPNHRCPAVTSLSGVRRGYPILIQTRNVGCAQALTVVRAMVSQVGVTFVGNPHGPASQFRWRLAGLPGWTCYGDGSGFPGHGAGGGCSRGAETVEWYHT